MLSTPVSMIRCGHQRNAQWLSLFKTLLARAATNNYVDDITHSFSGQDLTLTLSRSGGLIDLFEVITIPSTGGGVALSDDDPVSVGISSNDPGSATDAARRDHRHQVGRASATQFGVSTYATDAEAIWQERLPVTHAINPVSNPGSCSGKQWRRHG